MNENHDRHARPSTVPLVLSTILSVLILGGALAAPVIAKLVGLAAEPVDLSSVRTYEIKNRTHSLDDISYPQTPPVGGQHAPVWLDCGVYDEPVRDENAVHDLEHGTVWITHAPGMGSDELDQLAAALPDNGIMSPHAGLTAPVVVTVWGAQIALDGADDERLGLFLAEYGDGHTAPEADASCHGGTADPGGEPTEPGLVV